MHRVRPRIRSRLVAHNLFHTSPLTGTRNPGGRGYSAVTTGGRTLLRPAFDRYVCKNHWKICPRAVFPSAQVTGARIQLDPAGLTLVS
jgi:hypothetical protein